MIYERHTSRSTHLYYYSNKRPTMTPLFECDSAIYQCIQGMIFAQSYIASWMVLSTSLSYNNVTCNNLLASKFLDS